MAGPNTDDEHHRWVETVISGFDGEWSWKLGEFLAQALLYPQPPDIPGLPHFSLWPGALSRWCACPGHSHDNRHIRGGRKRTVGLEECWRSSTSQAGILSLAHVTQLLRLSQRVSLCAQIFSLLLPWPPFIDTQWHMTQIHFWLFFKKKKRKKSLGNNFGYGQVTANCIFLVYMPINVNEESLIFCFWVRFNLYFVIYSCILNFHKVQKRLCR